MTLILLMMTIMIYNGDNGYVHDDYDCYVHDDDNDDVNDDDDDNDDYLNDIDDGYVDIDCGTGPVITMTQSAYTFTSY